MTDIWGQMPKAQDDARTIEEYIDEKIEAHNDDAMAHLGAGGALDDHRKYEVIDHVAGSLVEDKYKLGSIPPEAFSDVRPVLNMNVHNEAGWDTWASSGGWAEFWIGHFILTTSASVSGTVSLTASSGHISFLNWDRDWLWQAVLSLSHSSNIEAYWGICQNENFAGNKDGVFFKYDNGNLYAGISQNDGDEATQQITAPTIGQSNFHTYRIIYNSTDDKLYFYVQGELRHTFDPPTKKGQSFGVASFDLVTKDDTRKYMTTLDAIYTD